MTGDIIEAYVDRHVAVAGLAGPLLVLQVWEDLLAALVLFSANLASLLVL